MENAFGRRISLLFALVALCGPALNSQSSTNAAFPERQVPYSAGISSAPSGSQVTIPGPLRSLERMAGISQKADPAEVLPLLARNIFVQGYVGWRDQGRPTEFLILLGRYLNQAQELSQLAGDGGVVHVVNCQEAEPLLHILGYRLRQQCGNAGLLATATQAPRFQFCSMRTTGLAWYPRTAAGNIRWLILWCTIPCWRDSIGRFRNSTRRLVIRLGLRRV